MVNSNTPIVQELEHLRPQAYRRREEPKWKTILD